MSNAIRYDSLLVRHLARELDARLRGRAAHALRLDPGERRASLELEDGALLIDLHPTRGWLMVGQAAPAPDIRRLHRSARVGRVYAPPDERLLRIDFDGATSPTRPVRCLVLELMTNQWNALALDDEERIVAALWPRRAGDRELRAGRRYRTPSPAPREGAERPLSAERWKTLTTGADAGELVRRLAYASPVNAGALRSHDDYLRVVWGETRPVVLRQGADAAQPYPWPLSADARPAASLLEAMRIAAGAHATHEPLGPRIADPETLERVRLEIARSDARIERMEAQRSRALPQAKRLRERADLLLSRLHQVPRGAGRVLLDDFAGGTVELQLDPALSAADNARRMYDAARKRERAAERIPALLAAARRAREALSTLLARAETGEAGAAEIEDALPRRSVAAAGGDAAPVPYRRYTTSGGLEVRVGRSGRANDDLTFRHSSPEDIWLHARDVAGAHVVLRWPHADAGPPQRDLAEAAVLAALHSRARTSATVPVDWTRRKYVRKPRKAPPGAVLPDRVKTVFVEPDEEIERRMRQP